MKKYIFNILVLHIQKMESERQINLSNKRQIEILLKYMENNQDLAKGYLNSENGKAKLKNKWKELSEKLNANGPPKKTVNEWRRVST